MHFKAELTLRMTASLLFVAVVPYVKTITKMIITVLIAMMSIRRSRGELSS